MPIVPRRISISDCCTCARQLPAEAEAEYRTALRLDRDFVPAMVEPRRSRPDARAGPARRRVAAQGDADRAEECRCAPFARAAAGAAAQLRRCAGRAAAGQRTRARQCALCLCLRHRAEFRRRGCRCDGVAGTRAPAASGGSRIFWSAWSRLRGTGGMSRRRCATRASCPGSTPPTCSFARWCWGWNASRDAEDDIAGRQSGGVHDEASHEP